jgi:hypothetical protein
MANLKLALLSDLHAFTPDKDKGISGPSRLEVGANAAYPNQHPFTGLEDLIKSESLKADLLLCGGDLCDKADPAGASYVWQKLNELKTKFGAQHLIATAGNHDVDSRYQYNHFDAKGMLQTLRPHFPGIDTGFCNEFWAQNFAIYEAPEYRLVILNSAAFHGGGKDVKTEWEHGRISPYTTEAIVSTLNGKPRKGLNLLLCHHHPLRNNSLTFADYTEMEGGDALLDALPALHVGPWMIIHGHRHAPNLTYATGGASSAIVFSLGSFSAYLNPKYYPRDKNQFYLLDVEVPSDPGIDLKGQVTAWDWIDMEGWKPAAASAAIPARAGFGYRGGLNSLAANINTEVRKRKTYKTYDEIRQVIPDVHYLVPKDIPEFRNLLEQVFHLKLTCLAKSSNPFDQIQA